MNRLLLLAMPVLLAHFAAGCSGRPAGADPGSAAPVTSPAIVIRPLQALGPVNRLVLGHNLNAANGRDLHGSQADTNDPRAGQGAWDVANHRPIADTVAWSKAIGMGLLRYPGGCKTHNFDWRQAVGPLATRPYYTFGIDEYLTFCQAVGAVPLMTVSEIAGPAETAALIEYLNAPATPAHPWAQRRAAWGHPEPWGVRWFEMANESDHGNHAIQPPLRRSAAAYATWVVTCSAGMRAVDPSIRIGAHLASGLPFRSEDPWNRIVLEQVGTGIDFVALHTYAVGVPPADADPGLVGRACLAAASQLDQELADCRRLILECTGADIPLAITEYNAHFVCAKPWRFSFAAGLHSADQIRLMLEPRSQVVIANYWSFLNGYWGFLRGPEIPEAAVRWQTTAAAPLFRLWGEHVGATQVAATVLGVPRLEFEGFLDVHAARGDRAVLPVESDPVPLAFLATDTGGVRLDSAQPGTATIGLHGLAGKRFQDQAAFPVRAGWSYRLDWEQRISPIQAGLEAGLGLGDLRGWDATRSACGSVRGEPGADGWIRCRCELRTLPDARALVGVLRLEGGGRPVDASIEIRRATVTAISPATMPAFAALTTHASLSADLATLHLVVFNKGADRATTLQVTVADGSARSARAWCVDGPLDATNLEREEVKERLGGASVPDVAPGGFAWTFPPHSMTAFAITREP